MNSPASSSRPFAATGQYDNQAKDVAEALDKLARAVSAIDHKPNVLIARLGADSSAVAVLAASLEGNA